MNRKKVVLAFSGGLDTTFCLLHFIEEGFDVITVIVDSGGFSKEELNEIEKRALFLGAKKHFNVDAKDQIYDNIVSYIIKFNALYQGDYPLMCTDRYIIAKEVAKIAEDQGAKYVAHGSTANGNDQIRFDSAFFCVAPQLTVLCPIKYLNISREEEIAFLDKKNIDFDKSNRRYSINENIFGLTFSGSEIDEGKEVKNSIFKLSKVDKSIQKDDFNYIKLQFKGGLPIAINDKKSNGLTILSKLNKIVGRYGYGRGLYVGDCIIGIKGRIAFEAPGVLALIKAHKKLSQYVLTKQQIEFHSISSGIWSDLAYSGLYYEPLARDLEVFCNSTQKNVSGMVKLKVSLNKLEVVEIDSKNSLIDSSVATYAQSGSWSAEQADGFIKLYTMQQRISSIGKRLKN